MKSLLILLCAVSATQASVVQARRPVSSAWAAPLQNTLRHAAPAFFANAAWPGIIDAGLRHRLLARPSLLIPVARLVEEQSRHSPETFWALLPQEERLRLVARALGDVVEHAREDARALRAALDAGTADVDGLRLFFVDALPYLNDDGKDGELAMRAAWVMRRRALERGDERELSVLNALAETASGTREWARWDFTEAPSELLENYFGPSTEVLAGGASMLDLFRLERPGGDLREAAARGEKEFLIAARSAFYALGYAFENDGRTKRLLEGEAGGAWAEAVLEGFRARAESLYREADGERAARGYGGERNLKWLREELDRRVLELYRKFEEKERNSVSLGRRLAFSAVQNREAALADVPLAAAAVLKHHRGRLAKAKHGPRELDARRNMLHGTREVPSIGEAYARWAEAAADPAVEGELSAKRLRHALMSASGFLATLFTLALSAAADDARGVGAFFLLLACGSLVGAIHYACLAWDASRGLSWLANFPKRALALARRTRS